MEQEMENLPLDDEVTQARLALEADREDFAEEEEQLYMGDRPLEDDTKVKRIGDIRLYFATFRFGLGRIKFVLLAVLFVFLFFTLTGALNVFAPTLMEHIGWLVNIANTLVFTYAFGLIAGWDKRTRLLGQIAIVSEAVLRGTVPKHPYKTGLQMAEDRFKGAGVGKVIKESLRFFVKTVCKRHREKGELKKHILTLLQEIITLLMLMFADMFAKLGSCIIAYAYFFPGANINIRTTVKATRRYFKHLPGIIGRSFINFGLWLVAMSCITVPVAGSLEYLLLPTAGYEKFRSAMMLAFDYTDEKTANLLMLFSIVILVGVAVMILVTGPFETIRMVRFYLKCLKRDGEGADEDLDAYFTRVLGNLYDTAHKGLKRLRRKKDKQTEPAAEVTAAKEDQPAAEVTAAKEDQPAAETASAKEDQPTAETASADAGTDGNENGQA